MKYLNNVLQQSDYKSFVLIKNNVIAFYSAPEYIKVKILVDLTADLTQMNIKHRVNKDFEIVLL